MTDVSLLGSFKRLVVSSQRQLPYSASPAPELDPQSPSREPLEATRSTAVSLTQGQKPWMRVLLRKILCSGSSAPPRPLNFIESKINMQQFRESPLFP